MDKQGQKNRQSAARKFMSSLEELEAVLQAEGELTSFSHPTVVSGEVPAPAPQRPVDDALASDLDTLFEEAAQDIERFMAEHPDDGF